MIKKLKAIEEAEPVNGENEELQKLYEKLVGKHKETLKKLAK